jgi:Proprotein convertase P-domain
MSATANRPGSAVAIAVAALLLASPLVASADAQGKKRGGKRGSTLDVTKVVNAPVPDGVGINPGPFNQFSALPSTIDVGKQFKGRRIRDVNVTVQTQGLTGTAPAADLLGILTAPNGGTVNLFSNLSTTSPTPNPSIGPLTLDDEARLELGSRDPVDPTELYAPWAGTATANGLLAVLDDGPVRGTWTLTIQDTTPDDTSSLVSWRLNVVAGKPYRTK